MFRSKSCREDIRNRSITNKYHCFTNERNSEAETPPSPTTTTNQQPPVMLRSYSTSTYSPHKNPTNVRDKKNKVKKRLKGLCEAEIQRNKRVAAYNVYGVENRVKVSVKRSFKWFKDTCSNVVYGLW
ncbi:unnamed protein product [Cochlearia groenlandica]